MAALIQRLEAQVTAQATAQREEEARSVERAAEVSELTEKLAKSKAVATTLASERDAARAELERLSSESTVLCKASFKEKKQLEKQLEAKTTHVNALKAELEKWAWQREPISTPAVKPPTPELRSGVSTPAVAQGEGVETPASTSSSTADAETESQPLSGAAVGVGAGDSREPADEETDAPEMSAEENMSARLFSPCVEVPGRLLPHKLALLQRDATRHLIVELKREAQNGRWSAKEAAKKMAELEEQLATVEAQLAAAVEAC